MLAEMTPQTYHVEHYDSKHGRRFRAAVYVPKSEGGPRREFGSWRDREREAKVDAVTILERLNGPELTDETVAELLDRWMRDYCAGQVRATTLAHYRRHIDDHIVPGLGDVPACDLKAADVARWQAAQLQTQSAKSVRNYRGVLGGALSWSVRLGELPGNVVAAVDAPKLVRDRLEPPPVADVQDYLAALEGTRYHLPVLIAAATGMRRGEVLGLEWPDFDLSAGTVRVRRQVVQIGSDVTTGPPKTKAGIRDLALPAFALPALVAAYQEARLSGRAAGRLFPDLKPDQLTHGLRATLQRKGLAPVRFHMLRHAVASTMLANGASMLEVQAQLGHADSVTTLGTYGHLLPGALSAAAGRYDQAWEEANARRVESGERQSDAESGSNVVELGSKRRQMQ